MQVIKAYLQIASVGGSTEDFLRLVNFTHLLIPGIIKLQRNNSRRAFFELRDDCFEVVTKRVHNMFKSDKITELCYIGQSDCAVEELHCPPHLLLL